MISSVRELSAGSEVSNDPTATAWFLICGGAFALLYGPLLWRNFRGIANRPHRGLDLRGQQRFGLLMTFVGPVIITMGVLILLNQF